MDKFYFAAYCIGGNEVRIYDDNGCGTGRYNVGTIVAPAALGPVWFAFVTERGICAINGMTGDMRNY